MGLLHSLFGATNTDPIAQALADAPVAQSAGPWQQVTVLGIGGLTALGFARNSEEMLVTSASGQSVISGTTGKVLYRNRAQDGLDVATLKGTRLDHPADERIDMAGLFGGGLRRMTNDGWSVEMVQGYCVLHPSGGSVHFRQDKWAEYEKDGTFYMLDRSGEDIRVFGFSWTGRTLVCASSNTLSIWSRPAPLTL